MNSFMLAFPERDALTFDISEKLLSLKTGDIVNSLIHLYRGELTRQLNYRNRLDRSTHWAVLISSGLTVLVLAYKQVPGYVSLLISFFVCIFCLIEARRYLYYTVVKERVRLLEVGFYSNHVMGPKFQSSNQSIKQSNNEVTSTNGVSINQPIKYEKGMKLVALPPVKPAINQSSIELASLSSTEASNPTDKPSSTVANNQSINQAVNQSINQSINHPRNEANDDWIPRLLSSIRNPQPSMTLTQSLLIRLHRIYLPLLVGVYIGWIMKTSLVVSLRDRMIEAIFFGALASTMSIFVYIIFPATVRSTHWIWQRLYWKHPNQSISQVHVDV